MAINPAKAILRQGKTALFICDVQEKFTKAIFQFDKMVQNQTKLVNSSDYTLYITIHVIPKTHVEVILFFIITYHPFLNSHFCTNNCRSIKYDCLQISALKIMNVPMLVSEQNPKSLGKTIPELDISGAKGPFTKMQFSMCTPEVSTYSSCCSNSTNNINVMYIDVCLFFLQINKELATLCDGQKPESIILIGIETHVCVENTAIDLRQYGYEVHTVADCCSSRTQEDRLLALEVCRMIDISVRYNHFTIFHCIYCLYIFFSQRMRDIGCHITTSENVIFKIIRDASHEKFKNVLTLIKTPTAYTGLVPIAKI